MHLMNDDITLKSRLLKEKNETIAGLRKRLKPESDESITKKKINRLEN